MHDYLFEKFRLLLIFFQAMHLNHLSFPLGVPNRNYRVIESLSNTFSAHVAMNLIVSKGNPGQLLA